MIKRRDNDKPMRSSGFFKWNDRDTAWWFGLKVGILLVSLFLVAGGCSKKPKKEPAEPAQKEAPKQAPEDLPPPKVPDTAIPGPPQWTFSSNAISFQIKADDMLNRYMDTSHTLVLCIYQLSDPNAFTDLAKDKDGIIKLLACTRFGETVSAVQKIIVHPGESRTSFMDRALGAQYVGIAGGYFDLNPDKATLLFKIPVDVHTKGLLFKKNFQIPGRLDVSLFLGPTEMKQSGPAAP